MVWHLQQNYPDMCVEPSALIAAPIGADAGSTVAALLRPACRGLWCNGTSLCVWICVCDRALPEPALLDRASADSDSEDDAIKSGVARPATAASAASDSDDGGVEEGKEAKSSARDAEWEPKSAPARAGRRGAVGAAGFLMETVVRAR